MPSWKSHPGKGNYNRQRSQQQPESLSFGNFEFQEEKRVLTGKGGGVRELHTLLAKAKRQQTRARNDLGAAVSHQKELFDAALVRSTGKRIKDDPVRLQKALAKRRNKKRKSAKQWAERRQQLEASVEDAVQTAREGKSVKDLLNSDNRKRRLKHEEAKKAAKKSERGSGKSSGKKDFGKKGAGKAKGSKRGGAGGRGRGGGGRGGGGRGGAKKGGGGKGAGKRRR